MQRTEFDYEVVHRNDKKHSNADGLSQMALIPTDDQPEQRDESTDSDTGSEAHIRVVAATESEEREVRSRSTSLS